MKAIRSALLTSSAHLSKLLVGFILLKFIALYLGAEGLGTLGHFMSAVTIVTLLAGGGVVNGIIKYVSEYRTQSRRLLGFISAATTYSCSFAVIVLVGGVAFSKPISGFLFGSAGFYWVVMLLAVAQLGFAFTNMVTGVCNGLRDTKTYAKIQMIGNLAALPVAWILVANYGVAGAAIAIVSVFFIGVFPAWYFFRVSPFFGRISFAAINGDDFKKLSSFTLMLATSALAFPIVEIIVREFLIRQSGYAEAGIWQGAIKLSSAYLGFFGVFLAYYFMPLISAEKDKQVIRHHVMRFMLLIMGLFFIGAVTLYGGRSFIVPLLLSKEFIPLESLIIYQLIGDFFKISAYVIGFVGVAKAATKVYVGAEILQSILFLGLAVLLGSSLGGAKGVFIGYMLAYAFYFIVCVCFFVSWVRK
ncbi:O-antigen translocase [Metapseudomonas resinovorans]|uniref:O-antigen translocase n=1 Tax=Metapseudomonas resinovorans TaxID=53412 RepID=UPI000987CB6A|nr:O-antigen translocase [Pseudomonas resinovorans]